MLKHKRVTFSLSPDVIRLLDTMASKNHKSELISKAIMDYARHMEEISLHERLKEGYLSNAEQDREIAGEFFCLENEALDENFIKEALKNDRKTKKR